MAKLNQSQSESSEIHCYRPLLALCYKILEMAADQERNLKVSQGDRR